MATFSECQEEQFAQRLINWKPPHVLFSLAKANVHIFNGIGHVIRQSLDFMHSIRIGRWAFKIHRSQTPEPQHPLNLNWFHPCIFTTRTAQIIALFQL